MTDFLSESGLQLDWDVAHLHEGGWPSRPDNCFLLGRLALLPVEITAEGGPERVLEVAAAEAIHSCKLNLAGMDCYVVEPSIAMLQRARGRMREFGARVSLVRGIGETLPFADASFDRVLLDSAIDHLARPDLCVREMIWVLKPDGRLIISFVNYGSLSTRLSRALYAVARWVRLLAPDKHLFWDTPVPIEHTFECTLPLLRRLCTPYAEMHRSIGVSVGWMVPGWGSLLARLPIESALRLLYGLDRFASRRPDHADFVISVWKPRRGGGRNTVAAVRAEGDMRIPEDDVVYPGRARAESDFWATVEFGGFNELIKADARRVNETCTGDPSRSWLEDVLRRGPFRDAACLGCDEVGYERQWIEAGGARAWMSTNSVRASFVRCARGSGSTAGASASGGPI